MVAAQIALVAFLSVTMTFSYCGYYEILELWDKKYFDMGRIQGEFDTPNDLQWDLAGIVLCALMSSLAFKFGGGHSTGAARTYSSAVRPRP
ncbi:MAG: hypothetical protein ACLGJB_26775 [Blastocatellia bacterium]